MGPRKETSQAIEPTGEGDPGAPGLTLEDLADATGLTPVHVSKVLSEFRRNNLIRISERSLTILDPIGFRRVANKR